MSRVAASSVVAFCVGNTFFCAVGYPASVDGSSMRPTLRGTPGSHSNYNGGLGGVFRLDVDWVFVNCWAARNYDLKRGEIVVFISPKGTVYLIPPNSL